MEINSFHTLFSFYHFFFQRKYCEKIFNNFDRGHKTVFHHALCIDFQKGFQSLLEQVLCQTTWQKRFQPLCPVAFVPWETAGTWLREYKHHHILYCVARRHLNLLFAQRHLGRSTYLTLTSTSTQEEFCRWRYAHKQGKDEQQRTEAECKITLYVATPIGCV